MTPRRTATFRHIEFLRLSEKRMLLIIVTPEGDVQNRIIFTDRAYTPSELIEAANFLNQNYAGLTFEQISDRLHDELRQLRDDMTQLMTARSKPAARRWDSTPRTTCSPASTTCCTCTTCRPTWRACASCSTCSSRRPACCNCWTIGSRAQGVQIYIGGESGLVPLDECSVVTAPYEVDGEVVGTVGVIGPTRMAYERVIPIVEITARLLSSALSQR